MQLPVSYTYNTHNIAHIVRINSYIILLLFYFQLQLLVVCSMRCVQNMPCFYCFTFLFLLLVVLVVCVLLLICLMALCSLVESVVCRLAVQFNTLKNDMCEYTEGALNAMR